MKTTKQFLTLALAAAFLTAGFSAGATSLSYTTSEWVIGNEWDFTDIDAGNGQWTAEPATTQQGEFWSHESQTARREYNVPTNGGAQGNGEFYHTPLGGEFIYSPNVDVFDLDPWYNQGQLSNFSPPAPNNGDYNFAGLVEFEVTDEFPESGSIDDFVADRSDLPGRIEANWNLNMRNRPTDDTADLGDNGKGAEQGSNLVVQNWQFPLTLPFDQLSDWDYEGEGTSDIQNTWMEAAEWDDTWAQIRFGTDGDGVPNRGYLFLASNQEGELFGSGANNANQWLDWSDWDEFETTIDETDYGYRHVGVTGLSGDVGIEVVPEPASMTLLGIGLAGFATRRVMSRKKKA